MTAPLFYLGTHKAHWLWTGSYPLFVSRRTLVIRKSLKRASVRWACDSGGFTELSLYGKWQTSPTQYVDEISRFCDEIGMPDFVAPQDWMSEPSTIARTGLSVAEHRFRTVDNYLTLRDLAPRLPIFPAVQGDKLDDYVACVDMYRDAGVDLTALPLVGLGSVCRRQATAEIAQIVSELSSYGIRLHGFGVKTKGLALYGSQLASCDSMSWSFTARREAPLPGHPHKACNNCYVYASRWRDRLITQGVIR